MGWRRKTAMGPLLSHAEQLVTQLIRCHGIWQPNRHKAEIRNNRPWPPGAGTMEDENDKTPIRLRSGQAYVLLRMALSGSFSRECGALNCND